MEAPGRAVIIFGSALALSALIVVALWQGRRSPIAEPTADVEVTSAPGAHAATTLPSSRRGDRDVAPPPARPAGPAGLAAGFVPASSVAVVHRPVVEVPPLRPAHDPEAVGTDAVENVRVAP